MPKYRRLCLTLARPHAHGRAPSSGIGKHTYNAVSRLVTTIVVKIERLGGLAQLIPDPHLVELGRQLQVSDNVTLLRKRLLRAGFEAGAAGGRDEDQPRAATVGSKWRLDRQAGCKVTLHPLKVLIFPD